MFFFHYVPSFFPSLPSFPLFFLSSNFPSSPSSLSHILLSFSSPSLLLNSTFFLSSFYFLQSVYVPSFFPSLPPFPLFFLSSNLPSSPSSLSYFLLSFSPSLLLTSMSFFLYSPSLPPTPYNTPQTSSFTHHHTPLPTSTYRLFLPNSSVHL